MSQDGLDQTQQSIVDEILKQLPTVLAMPEPEKSRCLFCLAYEYFLQNMEEEAFKLIDKMEPDYFKVQMVQDMDSVKDFDKIVITTMAKLMELGYFVDPKRKK